jgi:hypothetical protein
MADIRLPVQLVDRAAIQQGRFRACYNLLVMLFFMMSLTKHREFSVDFAHPIDPRLSAFLQSNASIDALSRGGALSVQPSDTDEGDDGTRDSAFASSRSYAAQSTLCPAHERASSSPSSTALKSDPAHSIEASNSRASSTEQWHSSSSHAMASTITPCSDRSAGDPLPAPSSSSALQHGSSLQRTHSSASLRSAPSSLRSSLCDAVAFNALERSVIETVNVIIDNSHNLDVANSADGGASFADACSYLQVTFPLLCNVDATRLAFERAAHIRGSLAMPKRSSDARLPASGFADFLIRALYYHKLFLFQLFLFNLQPPLILAVRVFAACEFARSAVNAPNGAEISENIFIDAGWSSVLFLLCFKSGCASASTRSLQRLV